MGSAAGRRSMILGAALALGLAGHAGASDGAQGIVIENIAIERAPGMEPLLPQRVGRFLPAFSASTPEALARTSATGMKLGLSLDTMSRNGLGYIDELKPYALFVRPDNRALMAAWKQGGSIVFGKVPRSMSTTIALTVSFRNTLSVPAVLSEARMEVESTFVDRQPLIQMAYEGSDRDFFGTSFAVNNFGWGNPVDGKFTYAFVNPDAPADVTTGTTIKLRQAFPATPGANWQLDARSGLASLGVDVNQFERWATTPCTNGNVPAIQCSGAGDRACLEDLTRKGLLGSLGAAAVMKKGLLMTDIVGTADYSWKDRDGTMNSATGPFRKTIGLGRREKSCEGLQTTGPAFPPRPPPPELSPEAPVMVDLVMDKEGYTIDLPVEQTLAPGQRATVRLHIRSGKSSTSRLRIVLKANGTNVSSPEVDLLAFVARQ